MQTTEGGTDNNREVNNSKIFKETVSGHHWIQEVKRAYDFNAMGKG